MDVVREAAIGLVLGEFLAQRRLQFVEECLGAEPRLVEQHQVAAVFVVLGQAFLWGGGGKVDEK